jgi:hypothetical protein
VNEFAIVAGWTTGQTALAVLKHRAVVRIVEASAAFNAVERGSEFDTAAENDAAILIANFLVRDGRH